MIRLSLDKVLSLHEQMAKMTGGDAGVRDTALLESALSAPFQTFGGKDLYPTVCEKGARLAYGVISDHPFVDGNKRMGMLILLTFLELNGARIRPDVAEVARVGIAVAAGEMGYQDLLAWVKEW